MFSGYRQMGETWAQIERSCVHTYFMDDKDTQQWRTVTICILTISPK